MTAVRRAAALFTLLALLALPAFRAAAHEAQDEGLAGVGVDERLGARVPMELPLIDLSGKTVRLGDYLRGGPAILTLNYYTCPMLCPLTFRSYAATMDQVKGLSVSKDYRIVTVSINPEEEPRNARARADETHSFLKGLADADDRWLFLRGSPESIRRLTESVGFRYKKVGVEYAHATVAIVLTPDGAVSRYLYGIEIPPLDLKLALIEAAGGKIGASTAANAILMFCYQYDPAGRKYALVARNIMKAAGAATLLLLAALFLYLRIRPGRRAPGREAGE
ncbi:MAG: SCO family protein [Thermodesulfobacteriota bacterium]